MLINLQAVYPAQGQALVRAPPAGRTQAARPQGRKSVAPVGDARWAIELTYVYCGADGWGHLAAIIDCSDREIVGWEFSLRDSAWKAERALEEACLARFGTLRPDRPTPGIRSDSRLLFTARRFRAACRDYRLSQESVTTYTPEQNGMIERFFRNQAPSGGRASSTCARTTRCSSIATDVPRPTS